MMNYVYHDVSKSKKIFKEKAGRGGGGRLDRIRTRYQNTRVNFPPLSLPLIRLKFLNTA